MAHLLRLIAALLLCMSGSSMAAVIADTAYYWTPAGPNSATYSTPAAACSAAAAAIGGGYSVNPNAPASAGACNLLKPNGAPDSTGLTEVKVCPPYSENAGGGTCSCKTGSVEKGGSCVVPYDPNNASSFCGNAGAIGSSFRQTGKSSGSIPSQSCYMPEPPFTDPTKGCVTTINDGVAVPNADGSRSWSATGVATGQVCTPGATSDGSGSTGSGSTPAPPSAAPNPCPNGFPGTVNGMAVCAQPVPDNGVDSKVTTSQTAADGTKSVTVDETKCNGGTCVTNTTINNYSSSGGLVGTNTTSNTQPITSLCAKNPGNKVCSATGLAPTGNTGTGTGSTGNTGTGSGGTGSGTGSGGSGSGGGGDGSDSSFTGTCAAGFKAVSEDAVINAMAEETFRQNCKVNPDADSQKEGKAEYEKNEKPVNMTKDNPNNGDVKIGPGDFDTSNAIGGGGCIADKAVTVAGKSITLPLSSVCPYLEMLGSVLLACSFLLAARIVTRG